MKRQSLREFIKEHRAEIDQFIAREIGQDHNPRPNDEERWLWMVNHEGLWEWARSEGVRN